MKPFSLNKKSTQETTSLPSIETLKKILEQEHTCLTKVIELLKFEHQAIVERNVKAMDGFLDQKLPLLSKLEQLDKQRQQFFEKYSPLAYDQHAFSSLIELSPTELQDLWHAIKEQLPECKKQNELNGRIISVKKDNTEQLLQILLGRPVNNSPATYSHLGQTKLQKRSALYTSV